MNKTPYFYDGKDNDIDFFEALDVYKDSIFIDNVDIKVLRSLDDSFHIRIVNSAHGRTRFAADTTAASIRINTTQTDSIFTIDQGIFITKKQKFRNQQVAILISVPVGKSISLPKSNSVANYDNNVWEFQNWHNENKKNQEFQMTEQGLKPLEKMNNLDSLIELKKLIEKKNDEQATVPKSI